jgi:hypothetical protein
MRWFKKKSKAAAAPLPYTADSSNYHSGASSYRSPPSPPVSRETLNALPEPILERIFAFVCPHTQDDTYESCEQSAVEDTCMLCDLRDLSHCAQTSRRWRRCANNVM